MDEFKLIERFFAPLGGARKDVTQGIGDDGAIVSSPSRELVLAVDTLVEGCHFPGARATARARFSGCGGQPE